MLGQQITINVTQSSSGEHSLLDKVINKPKYHFFSEKLVY